MTKPAKCIKDLAVGDRVVTSVGTGTITNVEPCPFVEVSGSGPATQVTWEVNGEQGHYVGCGDDKIELAATISDDRE